MTRWDPGRYLEFADERARPFADLTSRIRADRPARVVDLGCGPGTLTRALARRWPAAAVEGIDSSAEMVARAVADADGDPDPDLRARLRFTVGDLRDWVPGEPVDVLVSNATLQWVPGHLGLLARLLSAVRPGGWFAFQVPGNAGERTHTAITELLDRPRWRDRLAGADLPRPTAEEPAAYLEALLDLGVRADVWETTYLQVLSGPDAVVRWMAGTGLRPVLGALDAVEAEEFLAAYRSLVADAYPERAVGTVLPYRRIFAVAQR